MTRIKSEPITKAIDALNDCTDVWFYESGVYVLTPEYIKQRTLLISIMKNMLEEVGEL
jgi:hypothetical protein